MVVTLLHFFFRTRVNNWLKEKLITCINGWVGKRRGPAFMDSTYEGQTPCNFRSRHSRADRLSNFCNSGLS